MSLAKLREQRRPVLPPLSPAADRVDPQPGAHNRPPGPAADVVPPAAGRVDPSALASKRPAATSRPAVGGARLDSLLSSLIANAPQVAPEPAAPPAAAASSPEPVTAKIGGPARRFPWRFVLGVAGAGLMAALAVAGMKGLGARLAAPGRLPDGTPHVPTPASNVDAWIAANSAPGETIL